MKLWKKSLVFTAALFSLTAIPALARNSVYAPYRGYEYNDYRESTAAPVGYLADKRITAKEIGVKTGLSAPSDIYFDNDSSVYILDSGNSRVLAVDTEFRLKKSYQDFHTADGGPVSFEGAQGLIVDKDGNLYIADTENNRVLIFDNTCLLKSAIQRPDEALTDTDAPFRAAKLLIDRKNRLYVIADSINLGAMVFDENGKFQNFRGSNPVVKTLDVISNFIRKRFMTRAQMAGLMQATPSNLAGFDMDLGGFIYTVAQDEKAGVQCLNFEGTDILSSVSSDFGDLEWDRGLTKDATKFVDVDVDSKGFINLLDGGRGKVFQYMQDGRLVAVFGSYGSQSGSFIQPSALESIGDNVYVVDSTKNCIFRFVPTEYAKILRAAFLKLHDSDFEGSLELWNHALRLNTNSQYPYYGIGMAYDAAGKYSEAMEYFRLAGAREEYSNAFREYRKTFVKENFLFIILVTAVITAGIVLAIKALKKRFAAVHGTAFSPIETKKTFPVYTALHPADGFEQFKTRKIESYGVSFLLVLAWFLLEMTAFFCTGFVFNSSRPVDYNLLATLMKTAGVFLLFIAANWSVCTLFNGKGTLKEITAVTAYSLLPLLISLLINVFLSNVLTTEEAAFLSIVAMIGTLWSCVILLVGLYTIHEYSMFQTILSILVTLVAMVILVFLIVLFYTLLQQAFNFIRSIWQEAQLR